jgi:hypothetical protein
MCRAADSMQDLRDLTGWRRENAVPVAWRPDATRLEHSPQIGSDGDSVEGRRAKGTEVLAIVVSLYCC